MKVEHRPEAQSAAIEVTAAVLKVLQGRCGVDPSMLPTQVFDEITEQLAETAFDVISDAMEKREATIRQSQLNGLDFDINLLKNSLVLFSTRDSDFLEPENVDIENFMGEVFLTTTVPGTEKRKAYHKLSTIDTFVFEEDKEDA